jgi:mannosyl-3-phosphoglycerate phosphatase
VKPVVFTDLDETLLSRHAYSFAEALPALNLLKERDIPLVICSSKTKAEIEVYRRKLENSHPFITENGGGIFLPRGYFSDLAGYHAREENGYEAIVCGVRYERLREVLEGLRARGFPLQGFGDMTAAEVAELTGLSEKEAVLAKKRHFDETFIFDGDVQKLRESIRETWLTITQGRLFHLTGENDKGKAVEIVQSLYARAHGDIVSIVLGDSPTDIPMLARADYPVLVRKDDGTYDERVQVPGLMRAQGIGPEGWNTAVREILEKLL